MNWGKGIVVAMVLFAIFIVYFVVKMILSAPGGIPEKYYEKGNKYQEVIDAKSKGGSNNPKVEYNSEVGGFVIQFDSATYAGIDSVHAAFHWPPDARKTVRAIFYQSELTRNIAVKCPGPTGGWNAEIVYFMDAQKFIFQKKVWKE